MSKVTPTSRPLPRSHQSVAAEPELDITIGTQLGASPVFMWGHHPRHTFSRTRLHCVRFNHAELALMELRAKAGQRRLPPSPRSWEHLDLVRGGVGFPLIAYFYTTDTPQTGGFPFAQPHPPQKTSAGLPGPGLFEAARPPPGLPPPDTTASHDVRCS